MVFKKDDPQSKKWSSKGGKNQAKTRKLAIDLLWENWRTGFADKYEELMNKLMLGTKLNEAEKDFCDRYDKNLEFITPKLARTDHTNAGKAFKPIEKVIVEIVK